MPTTATGSVCWVARVIASSGRLGVRLTVPDVPDADLPFSGRGADVGQPGPGAWHRTVRVTFEPEWVEVPE
jgi:hypothetical protein